MRMLTTLGAFTFACSLLAAPAAPAQAQSCDTLKEDYAKNVRPKLSRVVSRNPTVANLYLKNLNALQKGDNPTPQELEAAHKKTVAACDKQSGAANCKTFANDMLVAAKLSYDVNKKWAVAGCPGTLTSSKKTTGD